MRGFVSGVFWGLVASAVVLVVAALQLGDPGGGAAEVEVVEPALAPNPEAGAVEGEVIVTTDPAEAAPTTGEVIPDPAEEVAVETPPEAEAVGSAEAAVIEAEPEETPRDPTAVADDEAVAAPAPDAVEERGDGTVVIEQTVPVEPVED